MPVHAVRQPGLDLPSQPEYLIEYHVAEGSVCRRKHALHSEDVVIHTARRRRRRECYIDVHVSMKTDDMRLSTTTTVLEGDAYG